MFLDEAATASVMVVVLQVDIRNGALPNMKKGLFTVIQLSLWIGGAFMALGTTYYIWVH
jgi:hypothetical protein